MITRFKLVEAKSTTSKNLSIVQFVCFMDIMSFSHLIHEGYISLKWEISDNMRK